ncbi:unnamed protein product [Prunus armeniaca]
MAAGRERSKTTKFRSKTGLFSSFFRQNHGGWWCGLSGVGRGRRPSHFGTGPDNFGGRTRARPAKTWPAVTAVARKERERERERDCAEEREREREMRAFLTFDNPFRNIYDYATEGILFVSLSLQLRFELTTCL